MRYASEVAARRGWEMYRTTSPAPRHDEINAVLDEAGLPAISNRMYDHFSRLTRYGVEEYMPINEFDIARKNGRFDKMSA